MKTSFFLAFTLVLMSAFVPTSNGTAEDNLKDPRDGQVYKTVKIGDQVWMAQNLNYQLAETHGSYCYKNSASNCDKYGRLYDWENAKRACPDGWHLPSKAEWEKLISNYSDNETAYKNLITGGASGFNATLHGVHSIADNQFVMLKQHGAYWTSTDFNTDRAWVQRFLFNSSDTYESQAIKVNGQGCRCVKN